MKCKLTYLCRMGFVLLVVMEICLYLVFDHYSREAKIAKFMDEQGLNVVVQTDITEVFFNTFSRNFTSFSKLSTLAKKDSFTEADMDEYVDHWSGTGLVGGILLLDENGVVILNSATSKVHDVGEVLADRDYFLWAKNQKQEGEFFVGQPVVSRVGASKGLAIIPIAAPVVSNNVLTGVLVASVRLEPLMNRYLHLLKNSKDMNIYLLSKDGVIFYNSSHLNKVGTRFDHISDEQMNFIINSSESGSLELGDNLVSFSPMQLADQDFELMILTDREDVLRNITTTELITRFSVLLFVIFTIFLYLIVEKIIY